MRLATFVAGGRERFGLVLAHPATGEDWVFDPVATESRLYVYAARPTAPFFSTRPIFAPEGGWPARLVDFLALGDDGLSRLRRLEDTLRRFLEQTDQALLVEAGFPVSAVKLRAPICSHRATSARRARSSAPATRWSSPRRAPAVSAGTRSWASSSARAGAISRSRPRWRMSPG
jgi:hypothetical protein